MYSNLKGDNCNSKTAKGIKKNIIKQELSHQNYKNTLFSKSQMLHTMKSNRSELNLN